MTTFATPGTAATSGNESLICGMAHVRVATAQVEQSTVFAEEFLGLEPAGSVCDERCFRTDLRRRSLSFFDGAPMSTRIGLEVRGDAELDLACKRLVDVGFEAVAGEVSEGDLARRIVATRDGSGNRFDLVVGPTVASRRPLARRDRGITGLQGVGLRSQEPRRDVEFWAALGCPVSDWAGDVTYISLDHQHHRIALYPSTEGGLLYAALEVESFDHVMQAAYEAADHDVTVIQGPGRQPASGQRFLHVAGPDHTVFSLVHGIDDIGREHQPRQFETGPAGLCSWGSVSHAVPELSQEAFIDEEVAS